MKARFSRFRLHLAALLVALGAALLAGPASAAPCTGICFTPGDYSITTLHKGLLRNYLVHVPASYTGQKAVPLLLDFHGFSKDASNERQWSGQLAESDKRGFIVVWPNGVSLSWNAYGCCFLGDALNIDDVSFNRAVITAMKGYANIDADRVFVTGISNGGGMAQRMACEAADLVRASVSVSYPLNRPSCAPAKPISMWEIAGTADGTISYAGNNAPLGLPNDLAGIPLGVQGARESLAAWKAILGCSDELYREQLPDGTHYAGSRFEEYRSCNGGVRTGLVTIANGEHVLYNGYTELGSNPDKAPIDVAPYIWDHFFNL
ncbi:PHB depolymerase family esterase [Sphingomonas sp. HITSZ_GF]|uniref:alpha/beta hydrolase family esterase n=1 Tax=Sphingomonas sp. HITSZ_GF TaxID=3037247 RepID=UPI00240E53C1|nr:PHB depolymerase family esterase [Sphingomonas sp. HITSZ_GF]MDG2535867.1 PHB depolymerase family esterase [Sphingomonas sp. HITSZ_GF]